MKFWGKPNLTDEFSWTPTQLLIMIKEVDIICPEETTLDLQTNNEVQDGEDHTTNIE
jgi:hypothetical protein